MRSVIVIVALMVAFALTIRLLEDKFIYFPYKYPEGFWHPERFGLQLEECWFRAADGERLHGWYLHNDDTEATLLWCHGNAGNISDRLDNLAKLANLPVSVVVFDYRGYGKSEGSPDEAGIYLDARAAYDYLVLERGVDPEALIVFGRSLGGAVAVDLVMDRRAAGLVLESTFTSAKEMTRAMFGWLPIGLVIKSRFDSRDKIQRVSLPKLFIHGNADQVVPFKLGRRLFEAAPPPKQFYEIDGAGHNDTYVVGGKPYFQTLMAFIRDAI